MHMRYSHAYAHPQTLITKYRHSIHDANKVATMTRAFKLVRQASPSASGPLEQRWDQWIKSNIFVNRQLNEQFLWHSCLRKLPDWEENLDLTSNLTCV